MKAAWIPACLLVISATCFAQHLKISPEKPSVTDSISLEYDAAFFGSTPFQCRVYFSGISSDEREFPRVSEVTLTKSGNLWSGVISSIPVRSTAMVITFSDSLNQRDTNFGKGYWSHLYENGNPLPGSWAGAGDLLYGNWITKACLFHLGENLDSAQAFFNKDILLHPEIKHAYMRQYLASLKTGTPETDQQLRDELAYFSLLPDLSELKLMTLKHQYARLKDTLNANRYEREVFTRFPNGSWTPQAKSLPLLIRVGSSNDFTQQAKAYQEFKKSFLKPYENEFAMHSMNYRAARMLVYMVNHFSTQHTLDLWKKEVSLLTDAGKLAAYQQGSQELLTKSQLKPEPVQKQLENKFYQFNLNPDQKLKDAETLATLAIELWYKNSDGPLRQNESNSMTKGEIIQKRKTELSQIMMLLGSSLLKQNKVQEAVIMLKESVDKSSYTNPDINEVYIEALVKSGDLKIALSETRRIISLGKSTPALDAFYAEASKEKKADLSLLKEERLEQTKSFMRQKLTKEKCPDFTAYDFSGKSISSKSLKNKIVVINFWASWCNPCIVELKSIDAVVRKFQHDTEVVFLSVNEDEVRERALKIINQYELKNHFAFDQQMKMVYAFGANGLPTQIIIDKKGEIRFRSGGLSSFNEEENTVALEAMISVLKALD